MSQQSTSTTPSTNTEMNIQWAGLTEARHIKAWLEEVPDEALIGVRYTQGDVHQSVQNTIHATYDRLRAEIAQGSDKQEPQAEGEDS